MCIAILKPDGENIKKDRLDNCFFNNDDGAGFMYAKDGILHFFKGFFKFKDFWNSYVKTLLKMEIQCQQSISGLKHMEKPMLTTVIRSRLMKN